MKCSPLSSPGVCSHHSCHGTFWLVYSESPPPLEVGHHDPLGLCIIKRKVEKRVAENAPSTKSGEAEGSYIEGFILGTGMCPMWVHMYPESAILHTVTCGPTCTQRVLFCTRCAAVSRKITITQVGQTQTHLASCFVTFTEWTVVFMRCYVCVVIFMFFRYPFIIKRKR